MLDGEGPARIPGRTRNTPANSLTHWPPQQQPSNPENTLRASSALLQLSIRMKFRLDGGQTVQNPGPWSLNRILAARNPDWGRFAGDPGTTQCRVGRLVIFPHADRPNATLRLS